MLNIRLAIRFIFNQKESSYSSYASWLTIIGLSIGVAAALEVQKIIHNDELLLNVQNLSNFIKTTLINELADHDFFRDVRGRGLRLSFEYKSPNNDLGVYLYVVFCHFLILLYSQTHH